MMMIMNISNMHIKAVRIILAYKIALNSLIKVELWGRKFGSYRNYLFVITGALACCNGDTWASELGSVLSFGDPVLITSLQSVPRGNVDYFFLPYNGTISEE